MDFTSFKKIEGLPTLAQTAAGVAKRVAVLVKLRKGAVRPTYITPRAEFGPEMFTAEIDSDQLQRLDADPAIESFSPSRALNGID